MCTAIKSFATETLAPAIKTTGENIQKGIAEIYGISKTIENKLYEHLPRPLATITDIFLQTAPFLAMYVTCPLLISLAVTGLFCTIKVIIATKDPTNFKIHGAWAAAGISTLYIGTRLVPWSAPLVIGLGFMLFGVNMLGNSGILSKLLTCCPAKQKKSDEGKKVEVAEDNAEGVSLEEAKVVPPQEEKVSTPSIDAIDE